MARSLDDILRMVSNMIERAEGLGDTPEAALMRSKAEELMRKYRIEEESLIAQDEFSITPILVTFDGVSFQSDFRQGHISVWWIVAEHCGVLSHVSWNSDTRHYAINAVGYNSDIRYARFLFESAKLMLISKLEPSVDPSESEAENIYRLRSAGIDRQRIAEMVWGKRGHQEGLKVGRLYKEACAARGEDAVVSGRGINANTYRVVYAREFVNRISARLREARDAADSTGGALILHGRSERVQEAFWTHFPSYRPQPEAERVVATEGSKKKGRALKMWTAADEALYLRLHESPTAQRAAAAGRVAADSVQISRVPRAQRVESTESVRDDRPEIES